MNCSSPKIHVQVLFLFVLAAGLLPAQEAKSPEAMPNVLFITVDTLRADHLSSYGYHLRTSPNIDKLAAEGTRFQNAYTVVPRTGPAHISMFTSRYPQEHGAKINGFSVPEDSRWLFLPQILRKFGYRNAAFVSAWVLSDHIVQLERWFDDWDEEMNRSYQFVNSMRYAEDVTPLAVEWLKQRGEKPFFLWVHYFDPHTPYEFRDGFEPNEVIGKRDPVFETYDEDILENVRNYDSEVAYTDHYVGELLDAVDDFGLRENTLVVLLADHGESLGEHDYVGHGRRLDENIIRIPLIFRWPGQVPEGKVVEDKVTILDLAPTIVDLTVRPHAKEEIPATFRGRSLRPAWTDEDWTADETIRYVTWAGQRWVMPEWVSKIWLRGLDFPLRVGYQRGGRKVVWIPDDEEVEVTQVSTDPHELRTKTHDEDSGLYKSESTALRRWHDSTNLEEGESRMTERDVEVLKSLGYLQ